MASSPFRGLCRGQLSSRSLLRAILVHGVIASLPAHAQLSCSPSRPLTSSCRRLPPAFNPPGAVWSKHGMFLLAFFIVTSFTISTLFVLFAFCFLRPVILTSLESENYDYPPAPQRLSRAARSGRDRDRPQRPSPTQPAQAHHLRSLLSSDRNRSNTANTARALETLDQELEEYRSDSGRGQSRFEQIRADLDRQIQQLQSDLSGRGDRIRHLLGDHATMDPFEMNQEPSRPPDTSRQISRPFRRRTTRDNRIARGSRPRETENNTLLDEPVPHIESPTVMPQDVESDRQMNRRRTKRRKLESDDAREGVRGFSYGEYGQVVPGVLRMELASCDGGIYEPDGESSFPDNVLRNDSSVYCTKSDRCNLILRHLGGAPFCLKRIVIKAPKSGYDSP